MRVSNEMKADYSAAFKPSEVSRERASRVSDSLSSSTTSTDNNEGIASKMKRVICFVPMVIITVIKRVIYFLSCCMLCRDTADPKAVAEALEPVIKAWGARGSKEDKEAAWNKFEQAFPYQKEQLVSALVEIEKKAGKAKDWTADKEKTIRDNVEGRLKRFDQTVLESYRAELVASK